MRRAAVLAAVGFSVFGVLGCSGGATPATYAPAATLPVTTQPVTHSLHVTMAGGYDWATGACTGYEDNDVRTGAQLVVKDGSGTVIGVGELGIPEGTGCYFELHISVPETDFYTVEVGQHTTEIITLESLEADYWWLLLSPLGQSGFFRPSSD